MSEKSASPQPPPQARLAQMATGFIGEGNAPGFGSADMVMMTLTGGAERTAREFESLLARAGLTMTRVLPTTTSASIVEAQCA